MEGSAGNFSVSIKQHPRYIDMDKCIACGACAEKCPKRVPNEFDLGLGKRRAAHVKFSQAVPLKYLIDSNNCIYLTKGKCRACEKVCPTGAINFDDKGQEITREVGSIILTMGSECYDPKKLDTFGYQSNPDIITSLEFERMLSASGPFGGHLKRLSDKAEPKKIAFLQCAGSRSQHEGAQAYCSSVCCSFAVKEAMLAMDHVPGLETAMFYIDMRTQGKDVERYFNRAKEVGVRFIRGKVPTPLRGENGKGAILEYADEDGRLHREHFDLVVLSVGASLSDQAKEQLGLFGLEVSANGYPKVDDFSPVETAVDGIYLAGAMQAPKEIPFSVIDASAGAAKAGALLSSVRGELAKEEPKVEELNVSNDAPRIGVFVCNCGTNIAGVVDCPKVAEFAKGLPNVVYVQENLFSCSQDAQEQLAGVIKENNLNRVVVAACTPRTHEPLFQETLASAGLNKYLFEMANIRNQCSWVHSNDPEKATQKAMDQVRMAVAKAGLLTPLAEHELNLNSKGLVVGGGLAGISAALSLAEQGLACYLVEKSNELGGNARHLRMTAGGQDVQARLAGLIDRVKNEKLIEVLTGCEIKSVDGFVGNFSTIVSHKGEAKNPGARGGHPGHRRHGIPARGISIRPRPQGLHRPFFPALHAGGQPARTRPSGVRAMRGLAHTRTALVLQGVLHPVGDEGHRVEGKGPLPAGVRALPPDAHLRPARGAVPQGQGPGRGLHPLRLLQAL